MKKYRVLFIATLPPPVHGSSMVSQQIKDSAIFNDVFDADYVNLGTSRNICEIGKGGVILNLKKLLRFVGILLKSFILLLINEYDLCYCAITCKGIGFLKDAPVVLLCKLFRRKIIIHQHNKGMSEYVDRPLYRWLLPLVYKDVKVILLSWYLYPDIERVVMKENVMICPNGVRLIDGLAFVREPSKTPHILYLSNLLVEKGVLVLLDALKNLKDKGYSFICDFVGSETKDINYLRFYQEVQERDLINFAIYHGRKYGKDKSIFYERAEIFVLPSFNEAFPLVNIEAMEYNLPVISTRVGGIPDEIIDGVTGYIIEPKNVISLTESLERLLVNPILRKEMGNAGRKLLEEKYTEEIFEKRIVKCFLSVVE